jgi:hypothetical protein
VSGRVGARVPRMGPAANWRERCGATSPEPAGAGLVGVIANIRKVEGGAVGGCRRGIASWKLQAGCDSETRGVVETGVPSMASCSTEWTDCLSARFSLLLPIARICRVGARHIFTIFSAGRCGEGLT